MYARTKGVRPVRSRGPSGCDYQRRVRSCVRAAIAALLAAGCDRGPAPAPAPPIGGPDGLVRYLDGELDRIARAPDRAGAARALVASWKLPADVWPALVTAPYRPHHAAYATAFDRAAPALADAIAGAAGAAVEARWQYADDARLDGAQIRSRIALPDGRPGVIATTTGGGALPAVFAFDGRAWRSLAGVDELTIAAIAAADPACAATYAAARSGACLALSAPVAVAALDGDGARLGRACARMAANGCASLPSGGR